MLRTLSAPVLIDCPVERFCTPRVDEVKDEELSAPVNVTERVNIEASRSSSQFNTTKPVSERSYAPMSTIAPGSWTLGMSVNLGAPGRSVVTPGGTAPLLPASRAGDATLRRRLP